MLYLDMDGVLVDFVGGIRHRYMITKPWPLGVYSPIVALGLPDTLWQDLDEIFWIDLQPTEEFDEILNKVKDYEIATSAYNEASFIGKLRWCDKYLGKKPIFIDEKWRLANNDSFLVDDCDEQYSKFVLHGGSSLLFPREWNPNHSRDWREMWLLIGV